MNAGMATRGPQGGQRFLGKLPYVPDSRDLKLAKYIDKAALIDVARAPLNPDWSAFRTPDGTLPAPDTDPLYNNVAGCCPWSMVGHGVNMIGKQTGQANLVVTADMVKAAYIKADNYDPLTGANDNGGVLRDVFKDWQKNGLFGTKAEAYALVDWTSIDEVALGVSLGGGLYGGYRLPLASQNQVDDQGRPYWYVPQGGFPANQGPGTWGGHAIFDHGQRNGNTWGEGVVRTREWDGACCDELWIVVVDAWQLTTGRVPSGFAWNDFLADVQARTA